MRILMLSSRIPYPLTAGFRIRIYNEAKYLTKDGNQVDLLYLGDKGEYFKYKKSLNEVFHNVWCIPFSKAEALKHLVKCIVNPKLPFQVQLYQNDAFRKKLLTVGGNYDVIIGNHIRTAEYLKLLDRSKVILDLHDAISYNYLNAIKVATGIHRIFYKIEYKRVLNYECEIVSSFPKVVIISEKDKKWLSKHGADVSNISIIPVAVRDDIEDRKTAYDKDEHSICFLGKMSYQPNSDAVLWFSKEVFPALLKNDRKLVFYIMGIEPTEAVKKLEENPQIRVTGFIENPYAVVAKSMAMVVPIRNGAGIQNKVLESMLVGTPVVASIIAAEGIQAKDGEQLFIAKDEKDYVDKITRLIDSEELRRRIGQAGQNYIDDNYTWEALWKKWKTLIIEGGVNS